MRWPIASRELRAINVGGPGTRARWRVDPEDLRVFLVRQQNPARDRTV
ncbi:hypothetical protein ACFO6V_19980 [Promicromonospora alba]|uniref:Helix-turn-helix protein n=1 Tax=Promicromonospora alba TaxID=1616110 RepID=A0ABV9HMD2_9MICO